MPKRFISYDHSSIVIYFFITCNRFILEQILTWKDGAFVKWDTNYESNLFINATQRNLEMWPLWAVALYIQLKIIFTIHSSTVNWYIEVPFKADLTSLHIITVSCKLHFCFNHSTLIPIIFHEITLWVWTRFKAMCTKYNTLCDKICQWLATGRWFSPCTPASSGD